jgi:hypothetical protein
MPTNWDPITASRDTPEFPHSKWKTRDHLRSILVLDGVGVSDYSAQRQAIERAEVGGGTTDQRLRTYRKLYERLGVIRQNDGTIRLTHLGNLLTAFLNQDFPSETDYRAIQATAVQTLAKFQTNNPTEDNDTTQDILPILSLWRVMRSLDNQIHCEEWFRVILKMQTEDDIDKAIRLIREQREMPDYGLAEFDYGVAFGDQVFTDRQPTARFASHMSLCGWGGLIIANTSQDGYRALNSDVISLVDDAIASSPAIVDFIDVDEWFDYYETKMEKVSISAANVLSSEASEIYQKLIAHKNVILYGPPGTGKSYIVEKEILPQFRSGEEKNSSIISFHPSYGYENFVEGLRPVIGDGGQVVFKVISGVFLEIIEKCRSIERYCLFIDEINRGNVPEIFGEFLVSIENSKREQTEVKLSLSGREISVPENLHIIGAMNTSDRSLLKLDSAFRRRFVFHRMDPNYTSLEKYYSKNTSHKGTVDDVSISSFLQGLNRSVQLLIGRDHQIGHSDFFSINSLDDLNYIFFSKTLPQLDEYCHGDSLLLAEILKENNDQGFYLFQEVSEIGSSSSMGDKAVIQVEFSTLPADFFRKISQL